MTEVVNCGGGNHTRLREQLMCYGEPPAPIYKGGEEEAGPLGGAKCGESYYKAQVLVGFPFPFWSRRQGKGEGVGKGKGVRESWIRGSPDSRTVSFGRTVGL